MTKCALCKRQVLPIDITLRTCQASTDGVHVLEQPPDIVRKFDVVVVDQFRSISPYSLQILEQKGEAMKFEALTDFYKTGPGAEGGWQKPKFLSVDESYLPPFATTTYRSKEDGTVEVWKCRWDSSG